MWNNTKRTAILASFSTKITKTSKKIKNNPASHSHPWTLTLFMCLFRSHKWDVHGYLFKFYNLHVILCGAKMIVVGHILVNGAPVGGWGTHGNRTPFLFRDFRLLVRAPHVTTHSLINTRSDQLTTDNRSVSTTGRPRIEFQVTCVDVEMQGCQIHLHFGGTSYFLKFVLIAKKMFVLLCFKLK